MFNMDKPLKEYESTLAARYMLALAVVQGKILNATKLQKLLYIAYGFCLAETECRIVEEEVRAWPFGPVFPKVQRRVKMDVVHDINNPQFEEISKDEYVTNLFLNTIKEYGDLSATKLSEWSHEKGSPWYQTTQNKESGWNLVIEDDLIKDYFAQFDEA